MSPATPPPGIDTFALLAHADRPPLDTSRDRHVHGVALVATGVLLGAFATLALGVSGSDLPWGGLVTFGAQLGYLVAMVALAGWRERRADTRPRGARQRAMIAIAMSGIVYLGVSWPVYVEGLRLTWWAAALIGCLLAAPIVRAGWVVRRGPAANPADAAGRDDAAGAA